MHQPFGVEALPPSRSARHLRLPQQEETGAKENATHRSRDNPDGDKIQK
jgi:hypothetical protein